MQACDNEMTRIAEFFDDCAARQYMWDFDPEQRKKTERFIRDWAIEPGHKLLEPGCGSGRLTALLAEATGPTGEVLAMDISPGMIAKSKARHLPEHAQICRGSVYDVPRADQYFDRILCFCVFPHLTHPEPALKEMWRVLKPGGQLWVNHLEGSASLNRFHTDTSSVVSLHHLPQASEMQRLMKQAGFEIQRFDDTPESYILCALRPPV